ncbi:MAG: DUF2007 domain-containing protein [Chitinophagaceae bacterium]|nr:MAG: DUF2007 domain-containing protein [Chitinophagaceae bacterium]
MNFVLLSSYDNYIEAHIALGRLENAYINCHLQDDHSVTLNPYLSNAIGGIKLMVAESQAARANEVLSGIS